MSVRDVTVLASAQATAKAATEELEMLEQVFTADVQKCIPFLATEQERVAKVQALVSSWPIVDFDDEGTEHSKVFDLSAPGSQDAVASVMRDLHTVKGNARMLGLDRLGATLHAAESPVSELAKAPTSVNPDDIVEAVNSVVRCLADHVSLIERGFGDSSPGTVAIGGGVDDAVVGKIRKILREAEESSRRALEQIEETIGSGGGPVPLGTILGQAAQALPSLAGELAKPVPRLVVSGPTVAVDTELAGSLRDALVHMIRNSMAHGIESAQERAKAGKAEAGRITVEFVPQGTYDTMADDEVRIRVFDDGKGLAMNRLRQAARPGADNDEVAESIFKSGLSTAAEVTATSGRGVGMDAVRKFLEDRGCAVEIEFLGPETHGFRPFAITIDVPRRSVEVVTGV